MAKKKKPLKGKRKAREAQSHESLIRKMLRSGKNI